MFNLIVFLFSCVLSLFAIFHYENMFFGISAVSIAIMSLFLAWKSLTYTRKSEVLVTKKIIRDSTPLKMSTLQQIMSTYDYTLSKYYNIESDTVDMYEEKVKEVGLDGLLQQKDLLKELEDADTRSDHDKFDVLENLFHRIMQQNDINVLWAKNENGLANDTMIIFSKDLCVSIEHDVEPKFSTKYYEALVLGCCALKSGLVSMEYIQKIMGEYFDE